MNQKLRPPFASEGGAPTIRLAIVSVALIVGPLTVPMAVAVAGAGGACAADYDPVVDPANFTDEQGRPNQIDNTYLPLRSGTTFVYEGTEDGEPLRDVLEVTRRTKTIIGVTTTVVRDRVLLDGTLLEETFDWYAQDDRGNVWYFGEDSKDFDTEGNVISTHGSWKAGVDGAKPGVVMKAEPMSGDTYRQEYAPGVAEDMASVLSRSKRVTVPLGSFDDVLQTKDFTCLEAGNEHKYYAPGVGLVQAIVLSGGSEQIELVSVETGWGSGS
jgi:hypothetical protein